MGVVVWAYHSRTVEGEKNASPPGQLQGNERTCRVSVSLYACARAFVHEELERWLHGTCCLQKTRVIFPTPMSDSSRQPKTPALGRSRIYSSSICGNLCSHGHTSPNTHTPMHAHTRREMVDRNTAFGPLCCEVLHSSTLTAQQ